MPREQIINDQDKIWVNIERTINLGNYENIKLAIGESKTVTSDDSPIELRDGIMRQLVGEISNFVNEYQ